MSHRTIDITKKVGQSPKILRDWLAFALKKRKAQCTAVGEPENTMKRRKALLSEEELLVRKERELAPKVLHFSAVHLNRQQWLFQCLLSFTLLPDWLDSSHVCILWWSPFYCGETAGSGGQAWPAEEGTVNSVRVGSGAVNKTSWYGLVGASLSKSHTSKTVSRARKNGRLE